MIISHWILTICSSLICFIALYQPFYFSFTCFLHHTYCGDHFILVIRSYWRSQLTTECLYFTVIEACYIYPIRARICNNIILRLHYSLAILKSSWLQQGMDLSVHCKRSDVRYKFFEANSILLQFTSLHVFLCHFSWL